MAELADAVVYERTGRWAGALRNAWRRHRESRSLREPKLREFRALTDATAAFDERFETICLVELTSASAPRVLDWLARLDAERPTVKNIVAARSADSAWEFAALSAGTLAFVTSPADLAPAAELLARAIRRNDEQMSSSFAERVWARLPWGNARSVANPRKNR